MKDAASNRSPLHMVFILVAAGACAMLCLTPSRHAPPTAFTAEGYLRLVEAFINNYWLHAVRSGDHMEIKPGPELQCTQKQRDDNSCYMENSYLAADMRNPRLWIVKNGVVDAMIPSAHAGKLPSTNARAWQGNILYRDASLVHVGLLRDGGGTLTFTETPVGEPAPQPQTLSAFNMPADVTAEILQLYRSADFRDGGGAIAYIRTIAGTPVVHRQGDPETRVSVSGRVLNPGETAAIPVGGDLVISRRNRQVRFHRPPSDLARIEPSMFQRWGERIHDPDVAGLAKAMDSVLSNIVAASGGNTFSYKDVRLTLDRQMQANVQQALNRFIGRNLGGLGDVDVAVAVMDAVDGDILALASAPRATDDNPDIGIDQKDNNFRRLPVGSSAKIPFSTLILNKRPELENLQIRNGGTEVDTLLGSTLPKFGNDAAPGSPMAPLNFDNFVRYSSNKYAATLMMLSLSPPDAPRVSAGEGYWFGTALQTTRPLSIFEGSGGNGRTFFKLPSVAVTSVVSWNDAMREDFDIGDGTNDDSAYDVGVWQPLIDQFRARTEALRPIAIERENFPLDRYTGFRRDMIPLMLGGGDKPWTTIKLAQTYARIVTGSKVQARLVLPESGPDTPAREAIGIDPQVRKFVTHAMTLPALPGGTAASHDMIVAYRKGIAAADSMGLTFGLFSKTGTPQIDLPVYTTTSGTINALISSARLRLTSDRKIALFSGTAGAQKPAIVLDKTTLADAQDIVAQDAEALRAIRARNRSWPSDQLLHDALARVAADNKLFNLGDNYRIDGRSGKLVGRVTPDKTDPKFGKVYAFVIGFYPAGVVRDGGLAHDAAAPPLHALAVAINIQRKQNTKKHTAALFGAQLINDILVSALQKQAQGN